MASVGDEIATLAFGGIGVALIGEVNEQPRPVAGLGDRNDLHGPAQITRTQADDVDADRFVHAVRTGQPLRRCGMAYGDADVLTHNMLPQQLERAGVGERHLTPVYHQNGVAQMLNDFAKSMIRNQVMIV